MSEGLRPEARANKPEAIRELTFKEAADILFYSFYYSQGNIGAQRGLLKLISRQHPEFHLPHITGGEFALQELERYRKFFEAENIHSEIPVGFNADEKKYPHLAVEYGITGNDAKIFNTLAAEWGKFHDSYDAERTLSPEDEKLLSALIIDLIEADFNALYEITDDEQRLVIRRNRPSNVPRPSKGPFSKDFSQFVSFVLLNERTLGPDCFRQAIASIRDALQRSDIVEKFEDEKDTLRNIKALLAVRDAPLEDFGDVKELINRNQEDK